MAIIGEGDLLIYCAALNICNTYVKQSNSKINYNFKKKMCNIVSAINEHSFKNVYIEVQQNNGMNLLVVQLGEVQFSYNSIGVTSQFVNLLKENKNIKSLKWDGIRKQQCAATTFTLSKKNTYNVSNVTLRNDNLQSVVMNDIKKAINGTFKYAII